MKKRYLIGIGVVVAVIIAIFLISPAGAAIIDTIFSGETESDAINITFTSAGSNTSLYFEISRFVTVQNASMNVSGFEATVEGTYTGDHFDTSADNDPYGITLNETYFWITDFGEWEVYKYWRNGTYTGEQFDVGVAGATSTRGITQNGTFFWVVGRTNKEVYKFWMNGTYTTDHFDTFASGNENPNGITQNGTYFWITDESSDKVYKYWMNGTYTGEKFDTNSSGNNVPLGITQNGTFFWITDEVDEEVYKYWMNGTYTGEKFDISISGNLDSKGITNNGTFFWIVDAVKDEVYQYWMNFNGYPSNVSIDIEIDGDIEFNFTGELNTSNSPRLFNYTNFTTSLNNYINVTCTTDVCNVTMNISTDSAGIVQLDAISIATSPSRFYSEAYPSNVLETSNTEFNATILFESGENPIVYLYYNGTLYQATQIERNTNNATYRTLLSVPFVGDPSNESKSFYWNITDSELNYNTNEHNHTVYRMNLTNCTAPAITRTLNFTVYDEVGGSVVSSDLDSTWLFWSNTGDGTLTRNYSNGMDGSSYFSFCLYPAWANLTANAIIYYSSAGYEPREYHLNGYNLDNVSNNISLYLLSTGNATTFKLTVRDNSYLYYPNHIVRTLKYRASTDSFVLVESCLTDDDATCLTHLILEDVDYRFMVVRQNGTIIHTTGSVRAYCPQANVFDQCLLTVLIPPALTTFNYVWDEINGLSHAITFNNVTNVSSMTYSFLAGTVSYIRFKTSQGTTTICNSNSSAVAGVLTCDLNGYNGTVKQQIFLSRSDELAIFTSYLDLGQIWKSFGDAGLFFLILIIITIGIASVVTGSPLASIVLTIAALGIALTFGLGGLSTAAFIMLAVAGAFIIFKLRQ